MTQQRRINNSNSQNWTAEKLISMSAGMSGGLFNEAHRSKRRHANDEAWSSEHLAELGMNLSHGFHPGL